MTKASGRRVMIIEDDALLALSLENMLGELGFAVMAKASRMADALAIIAADPRAFDAATINIDLGGAEEVAARLDAAGVPFIVITGDEDPLVLNRFAGRPIVLKPIVFEHLKRAFLFSSA